MPGGNLVSQPSLGAEVGLEGPRQGLDNHAEDDDEEVVETDPSKRYCRFDSPLYRKYSSALSSTLLHRRLPVADILRFQS